MGKNTTDIFFTMYDHLFVLLDTTRLTTSPQRLPCANSAFAQHHGQQPCGSTTYQD